jgi:heme A synthase
VLIVLIALQILLGLMTIAWTVPTLLAMAHHMVAVIMLIHTARTLSISFIGKKGEKQ